MPKWTNDNATSHARATARSSAALTIRAQPNAPLTGLQRIFNRLTKRIATLERSIEKGRGRLENLLGRFLVEVGPVEDRLARRQIELAHALSDAHRRLPLRKRQSDDVRFLILSLFHDAFHVVEPDAAAIALHDEWAARSYREDVRRDHADLKSRLAKRFRDQFGVEAEVPDDIDDSPEGLARFRSLLRDQVRRAEEASRRGGSNGRASRNLREAEKAELRESLRKRSIREIYLSLAKMLHPDAVTDQKERGLREESMKQAIAAYHSDDLVTLLQLERHWSQRGHDRLRAVDDHVLGVYIATLQERATALARELRQQIFDPRFSRIAPVIGLPERDAQVAMQDRAEQLRQDTSQMERLLATVAECRTKGGLAKIVGDYLDSEQGSLEVAIAMTLADDD